jgi:hypothetical protein
METKQKLPKAFKAKWLKALRSGEYKQGRSRLKKKTDTGFEFCCLGVACEVAKSKIVLRKMPAYIISSDAVKGISKVPVILRGTCGVADKLASLNDDGNSFKRIALWIDKNL